jgi:hypothetical protein
LQPWLSFLLTLFLFITSHWSLPMWNSWRYRLEWVFSFAPCFHFVLLYSSLFYIIICWIVINKVWYFDALMVVCYEPIVAFSFITVVLTWHKVWFICFSRNSHLLPPFYKHSLHNCTCKECKLFHYLLFCYYKCYVALWCYSYVMVITWEETFRLFDPSVVNEKKTTNFWSLKKLSGIIYIDYLSFLWWVFQSFSSLHSF